MSDRPIHGRAPRTSLRPTPGDAETRSIADWMEPMMTVSGSWSTRALLKLLHDRDDLPAMYAELRELGLGTLQVNGTFPSNGRNWQPGQIHMTSRTRPGFSGSSRAAAAPCGPGPMVHRCGHPCSTTSRTYLKSLLDDQGFHEVLSTSNFCGAPNTRPGIPALVPSRWVNADGTVTAGSYPYGQHVRPSQAAAEVVLGYKTGLTFNYAADAGIVRSLPGKPKRRYVNSFIASLATASSTPSSPRLPPTAATNP